MTSLSRFPRRIYNYYIILYSAGVCCAFLSLLRLSRSFPFPPIPRLWSSALSDGLTGTSGLATTVAGYSLASPSSLASSDPPLLLYHFVGSRALSPLHPPLHSRHRSRYRPTLVPTIVLVPVPDPDPIPVLDRSCPSLGPDYPLGTMRVHRHRTLRTELAGDVSAIPCVQR